MRSLLYVLILLSSVIFASSRIAKAGSSFLSAEESCFDNNADTTHQKDNKLHLNIDLNDLRQTIHSFGASDCWTTKFIGQWADVNKKNKIADLLFSMDTLADGSPKGIGLSLWRFNIGAGSFEQGDSSKISSDWRREECFLNADGSYNWSKEAGQQWFLQAARKRGVKYTLGYAISPPVSMTSNGKASAMNVNGLHLNLNPNKYDDFANFLVKVAQHFHFDYISPVNEPQWKWGGDGSSLSSQEGSQATNDDIAKLVRSISKKLDQEQASSKVIIGEAGQWDFLYGRNTDGRGDQIKQFFSPSSADYIGDLPGVAHAISAHSYFTTCPDNNLVDIRRQVATRINQVDTSLETWMTEFGVLGNICDQYNGSPRHTGIDYGLYVAKVINNDLTIANVSSWQWWLAVNPYNYSDGLVYINAPSGKIDVNNTKQDGIVLTSKQLWTFGNYARFIRPGMQRINAAIAGLDPVKAASSVLVSAYKDQVKKRLVVVLVNMTNQLKNLQLNAHSPALETMVFNTYTTSGSEDLKRSYTVADSIILQPKSVMTLTGKYK